MTGEPVGLVARHSLDEAEGRAVRRLAALCNAHDGLDLKLALAPAPGGAESERNAFLYYVAGDLVGFCGLDGRVDPEVCGMVHPAHRRQGLGRTLLAAATAEARQAGSSHVLLICEAAAAAGQVFMAATGAGYSFAEDHMELAARQPLPGEAALLERAAAAGLTLHRADATDVAALAGVIAGAFNDPLEATQVRIGGGITEPGQAYYLARLAGAPVGALRVFFGPDKAGLYAFGVLPAYQRRGLGRQILASTIVTLRTAGITRVALEVKTTNAPAQALYQSFGFQTTTTYGYYRLAT